MLMPASQLQHLDSGLHFINHVFGSQNLYRHGMFTTESKAISVGLSICMHALQDMQAVPTEASRGHQIP